MKLITLNTWGGRRKEPLLQFLAEHKEIDIFCLQEIYNGAKTKKMDKDFLNDDFNLYSHIKETLPEYVPYFRPHIGDWYGLAIFVKKDIKIEKEGDIIIHDIEYTGGGNHPRNLQYVVFEKEGKKIIIANFHGLFTGTGKGDTPERLLQSEKIKDFLNTTEGEKILCGDFNLTLNTESVRILEQGMKNLIKEYNITSTRTSFYTRPERFADYIFVSPDIEVKDFRVLPDEPSDHTPLYLEF